MPKVFSSPLVILSGLLIVFASGLVFRLTVDPKLIFLQDRTDAKWIVADLPFYFAERPHDSLTHSFRKEFRTNKRHDKLSIKTKTLRSANVFFDGKLVLKTASNESSWKQLSSIILKDLEPGEHVLTVDVTNHDGPPGLLLAIPEIDLSTDASWQFRHVTPDPLWNHLNPSNEWASTRLANQKPPIPVGESLPRVSASFLATLPVGLLIFAGFFWLGFTKPWEKTSANYMASRLRWLLMGGWFALGCATLLSRTSQGMDLPGHIFYINFITSKGYLPLATDGWQTFQPPLFYLLAAGLHQLALVFLDAAASLNILVLISLICGGLLIELTYRTALVAFPENKDLQVLTLFVGSLFPVNLYMSQSIGNEPVSAVFIAWGVFILLSWIRKPSMLNLNSQQALLGLALGLALLSKVTALLVLPVFVAWIFLLNYKERTIFFSARVICSVMITTTLIAGWYYLRNWIELGKPIIGGWDTERGISWWQEPGYRIATDFLGFGSSLAQPVYAGTEGFWEALYSTFWFDGFLMGAFMPEYFPDWNYQFLMPTAWLSLPFCLAIIIGLIASLIRFPESATERVMLFCSSLVLVYLFAFIYLYATLPILVPVKGSYAMGLLPCLAVLCVFGFQKIILGRLSYALVCGLVGWWGVFSYTAYFINP